MKKKGRKTLLDPFCYPYMRNLSLRTSGYDSGGVTPLFKAH